MSATQMLAVRTFYDLVPMFTELPEPLKIANVASIGALVFIACHELARHGETHFGREDHRVLEFEADRTGLALMRQVYGSTTPARILRRYPHAEAGVRKLIEGFSPVMDQFLRYLKIADIG